MRDPRSRSFALIRAAALGAAVALAAAACTSTNAGWTFAPQPSITPAPSASGSAAPSSGPSANPSASGGPSGSAPAGGGTPGETVVHVAALNIAFDTQQIQAPAGQAFIIEFDNQDQGIPHNIAIKDPSGAEAFKGEIVTGPIKATYQVPALTKGTAYTFMCDVHPNMTGTVVVQ